MKISVVVLNKNFGEYLRTTLEVILSQDYYDFEVIVIDGGSSDNSVEILKNFGDRIRWVSEHDSGHGEGVFKGIQMSKGEVITFQAADDHLYPNALKIVGDYFKVNPGIVGLYGQSRNFGQDGEDTPRGYFINKYDKNNFKYDYSKLITRKIVLPTNAVFVNMYYLKKCNYKDIIGLSLCPDYRLWLELGSYGNFHALNAFLCKNRKHIGGSNINPKNIDRLRESHTKTKRWFFSNDKIPQKFRTKIKSREIDLRIKLISPNVWLNESSTKSFQEFVKILKSDILVLFFWPKISIKIVLFCLLRK
jgi:glycosyltransferase involved in cell wall biosynthesis